MKQRTCSRLAVALPVAAAFAVTLPTAAGANPLESLGKQLELDLNVGDHLGSKFDPPTTSYGDFGSGLKLSIPYNDPFPEGSTHEFWFPPGSPYAYDEDEGLFYLKESGLWWGRYPFGSDGLPPGVIQRPDEPESEPEPEPEPPTITFDEDTDGAPSIDSVLPELEGADPPPASDETASTSRTVSGVMDPEADYVDPEHPEWNDMALDNLTLAEELKLNHWYRLRGETYVVWAAYDKAYKTYQAAEAANAAAYGWDSDLEDAAILAKWNLELAQSDYLEIVEDAEQAWIEFENTQPIMTLPPPRF